MRILMICLGNICRSPLAEGILQSKLDDRFIVDSAGTGGWHINQPPDKRSIAVARKNGIDITGLRARKFSTDDFETFDLIYVMDRSNYKDVMALAQEDAHRQKVRMILENDDVPDPYFGGEQEFEEVYRMLDKATDAIKAQFERS